MESVYPCIETLIESSLCLEHCVRLFQFEEGLLFGLLGLTYKLMRNSWGVLTQFLESSGGILAVTLYLTLVTSWTIALQAPSAHGVFPLARILGWAAPFSGDLSAQRPNLGLQHCKQIVLSLNHDEARLDSSRSVISINY